MYMYIRKSNATIMLKWWLLWGKSPVSHWSMVCLVARVRVIRRYKCIIDALKLYISFLNMYTWVARINHNACFPSWKRTKCLAVTVMFGVAQKCFSHSHHSCIHHLCSLTDPHRCDAPIAISVVLFDEIPDCVPWSE